MWSLSWHPNSSQIHLRPWGLAPVPVMHPWVRHQHPRVELVTAPQFIPNSSTPLGSSSSTRHAPLGSAPAPTCGACHSTPVHLHPWGLAPVPIMHPWVRHQHPHLEPVTAPQFIPNSSMPLGSSSSTHHALLGLAAAPTCGACHRTPIHLHPWGLAPVPVMHS